MKGILCACLLVSLQWMSPARAYEADIHYSTTYVLARAAGWSADDARTIASANQGVDENEDTVAALEVGSIFTSSPHQADKNLRFHCFSNSPGQSGRISADVRQVIANRFAEVPDRGDDPKEHARRLIAVGAALHCQQDAYAHVSFGGSCGSHSGSCYGHTYETFLDQVAFGLLKKHYFNPDHPGVSGERLMEALQGTVVALQGHRPNASLVPSKEVFALSEDLRSSGLELPDELRLDCNRYIAGKWLFDFLHAGSRTTHRSEDVEKLAPDVAVTCMNASLASAMIARIPEPRFPRLNADALPTLVRANGSYQLLGGEAFDVSTRGIPNYKIHEAKVQLSHWRQLLALPLVAQLALSGVGEANHDFAGRAPAVDGIQRVGHVLQPVDGRDVRAQLALLEQREERREVGGVQRRLAPHVGAPEHADDRTALEQRQVHRNARDRA